MSLYNLSNAKIRIGNEKIVRKETEHIIDSSCQQKKGNAGFCLSLALCSDTTCKKEEEEDEEILVVMSLFKEEKEKISDCDRKRCLLCILILYRNLKKRESGKEKNILRMRQT
jgi:hypothetical protein